MLKKSFFAVLLIFATACYVGATEFKDLKSTDPAYPAVMNMVDVYRAISGYPDGTFKGSRGITRAEFSKTMTNSLDYLEQKYQKALAEEPANKEAAFKDLKTTHWAYPFVAILVSKYKLVTGYPDGTFQPARNISRYELATLLGKTIRLIYARYDLPAPKLEALEFGDVKSSHWAAQDIQLLSHYDILPGESKQKFGGNNNATRFEVVVAIDQIIRITEKALAAKGVAPVAVAEILKPVRKGQLAITGGWGNIFESVSGTNNWMGFNLGATYTDVLNFLIFKGNWELSGKYGFNQLVYLTSSGFGPVSRSVLNENRYQVEFNTIYPLANFLGITGKLLAGVKYANFDNPVTPTSFTAANLGLVTAFNLFGRQILARGTYSVPVSRGTLSTSVNGQMEHLVNYEAAVNANIFAPILLGYAGETVVFSGGANRFYSSVFARYFLF